MASWVSLVRVGEIAIRLCIPSGSWKAVNYCCIVAAQIGQDKGGCLRILLDRQALRHNRTIRIQARVRSMCSWRAERYDISVDLTPLKVGCQPPGQKSKLEARRVPTKRPRALALHVARAA